MTATMIRFAFGHPEPFERIGGKVFSRLQFLLFRKRNGNRCLRFRWDNDPAATEAERALILDLMEATCKAATRVCKRHRRRLREERERAAKEGTPSARRRPSGRKPRKRNE